MATVLFTSLWKPITLLLCWARQSCYISSADMHLRMCAEPPHPLTTTIPTHTHTHTYPPTRWHAQRKRQTPAAALLTAPAVTFNLFVAKCIDTYSGRSRFFLSLSHGSATSGGNIVSAWKTTVYLPWGFTLGWVWYDYKTVFIIWEMKRPC